jgi:WD40 repeat protein
VSMWKISADGNASPVDTSRLNRFIHSIARPSSRSWPGLLMQGFWVGRGGTARIWNAATGQLVTTLGDGGAPVTGVQFGASVGLALTVDNSGVLRIWDTGVGQPVTTLQRPAQGLGVALGFTTNGQQVTGADLVISAGTDSRVTSADALTWDAQTGRLVREVPLPGITDASPPCSQRLAKDSNIMFAPPTLSASKCWVPPPPALTISVWDTSSGKLIHSFRPAGAQNVPLRVAIAGDGNIVAAGDSDGVISFWNVATRKLVATDSLPYPITELTSTPDGARFLAADLPQVVSGPLPPGDGAVLDSATGKVLARYTSPENPGGIVYPDATLSPDGGFLLAGITGLAPVPPGGFEAAYQVSTGQAMADLQAVTENATGLYSEYPVRPWAPEGSKVLAGTAIYACDACMNTSALLAAAASRIAWSGPLSAASDHPRPRAPTASGQIWAGPMAARSGPIWTPARRLRGLVSRIRPRFR